MSESATRALATLAAVGLAGSLTACESSQQKSARLARNALKLASVRGQVVTQSNPDVRVRQTAVLHDQNGTAAVVQMVNRSSHALTALPITIDVTDPAGHSLFRNDAAGSDPSLIQVPLLPARGSAYWVNDQVTAPGTPTTVRARVGSSAHPAGPTIPGIAISAVHLEQDPQNGTVAVGSVTNQSPVAQVRLVVYCVAIRRGRVVAAGRAAVPNLPAAPNNKPTTFRVFFIGDPSGARLEVSAPPTVLK